MAFKLHSTDDGHVPVWESFPSVSFVPMTGMALGFNANSGLLEPSAKPTHICMRTESAPVERGAMIPCVKISSNQVWENFYGLNDGEVELGFEVDTSADGLNVVTNSFTNGNFRITYLGESEDDMILRGRFVK